MQKMRGSRRITVLAVSVILLGAFQLVVPATATADSGATIVGAGSGRCLDVRGNVAKPKTSTILYSCNGQVNQAWTYSAAGELRVFAETMCLDVDAQSRVPGAVVQIYTCNGGDNQHWKLNADGTITGAGSKLCLDVKNARTGDSAPIQMWTCNGQPNQRWRTTMATADTQPPTVPENPRVSGVTCSAATFQWDAATDNAGVAFYDVYHDGQLMKSVSGSTLSTSLVMVAGAKWGLYVNARDAAGNVSQASTTVPVSPPPCATDTQPPTVPTALTASASGTTVTLGWAGSTDNVAVRAYDVYRDNVKVGSVSGPTGLAPPTTFVDTALATSTGYRYYVVARDGQDNTSTHSTAATASTGPACANPICTITQVAADTDIPWGLLTLPNGDVLYSRRDAHDIVELNPVTGAKITVGTVPNVDETDGEGGLLGLAISGTFATDHWLYIMHTSPTDNRIVRIKLENQKLTAGTEQILLSGILRNKFHNGGRLRFGPDGKLYASTGDAQNGDNAQNKTGLNGKILRLDADGTVPADNPFGNYVWSYGHRNPQGLAFDSSGRLWEQEFGNSAMDETNLIVKGGNYGWPACEGTSGACSTPGFIAPKRTYATADGSCSGIAIVRDVLYVACERGTKLYRETISGSSLTDVQIYFNGTYGRLRTVEPAPDGGLWLTTTNHGDKDSIAGNSDEKIFRVGLG